MISKEQEQQAKQLSKQYGIQKTTQRDGWLEYSIDNVALAELIAHVLSHSNKVATPTV